MRSLPAGLAVASVLLFAACESSSGGGSAASDATLGADGANPGESAVCARWNADRADLREGAFSGDVAACEPGTLSEPGPDNALRVVNLYRWMAGLPPVALDPSKSADAQACAVMMDANNDIDHTPSATWGCQSPAALSAARLSNLATTAAVQAVDLYVIDTGVPNLGHRRWVLSNTLGPIGVGSTRDYSCMHVINGTGQAGARWTAWPPDGDFPIQAARAIPWTTLEAAGWTLQSDALDLREAEVTVTSAGLALAIDVDPALGTGYGSTFGVSIRPRGWTMQVGRTYTVAVRGLIEDIDYDVHVVDCGR